MPGPRIDYLSRPGDWEKEEGAYLNQLADWLKGPPDAPFPERKTRQVGGEIIDLGEGGVGLNDKRWLSALCHQSAKATDKWNGKAVMIGFRVGKDELASTSMQEQTDIASDVGIEWAKRYLPAGHPFGRWIHGDHYGDSEKESDRVRTVHDGIVFPPRHLVTGKRIAWSREELIEMQSMSWYHGKYRDKVISSKGLSSGGMTEHQTDRGQVHGPKG